MTAKQGYGLGFVALFIATVFGANWAVAEFGLVPVGFGLMAPAGVFAAGLAFTARDMIHETLGRWWVIPAILIGAGLSWWVEPNFARASAVAFLASELADYTVYTPLRQRGWLKAVMASNVVGLVLDSVLFLWLAFGSLDFLEGQILAKAYMTVGAVLILGLGRYAVLSRHPSS